MNRRASDQARPRRKRYYVLLVLIGVVICGWSAGWFYLRSIFIENLDKAITTAATDGYTITCADREVDGFPFRYEVTCGTSEVSFRQDWSAVLGSLHAVALIYNPWHLIFEAGAPARFSEARNGFDGQAAWSLARSSIKYSLSGLTDTDLVIDDLDLSGTMPALAVKLGLDHAEVHLRRSGAETKDLEAYIGLVGPKSPYLPEQTGELSSILHVQMKGAGGLMTGTQPRDLLLGLGQSGLPIKVVQAKLESDDWSADVTGQLVMDGEGYLNGDLQLVVSDPEGIIRYLTNLFPEAAQSLQSTAGIALALGSRETSDEGAERLRLPLKVNKGEVRLGFLTLMVIPSLLDQLAGS